MIPWFRKYAIEPVRDINFTQRKTNLNYMIRCWFEICMCTKG